MAVDLTIYLDDRPGELARLGEVLGAAGVNIDGFCVLTSGGGAAETHVLVDDMDGAFSALETAGMRVASEQEVMVVEVEDRPGVLGEVTRRLGDADVNITLAYLATRTRLVLAADELAAIKSALT
ncbi:MAG TPA: ACT domain-containing protein [Nocardioidaceae bacterium]|jgi:hypothetical protein